MAFSMLTPKAGTWLIGTMTTTDCPCGRRVPLSECCGRFHAGLMFPLTAEQLMRSRYAAFALGLVDYLEASLWPKKRSLFDRAGLAEWMSEARWTGLEILAKEAGGANDQSGTVTFAASYEHRGKTHTHREKSQFKKRDGRWYYVKELR